MRLKNQAKILQFLGNSKPQQQEPSKDGGGSGEAEAAAAVAAAVAAQKLKPSLVPGYEDDSEGEEEAAAAGGGKKPRAPLFPIPEAPTAGEVRKFESAAANTRVYDYRGDSEAEGKSPLPTEQGQEPEDEGNAEEDAKLDLEAKANKFFESIEAPTKAFQRKKRIDFDGNVSSRITRALFISVCSFVHSFIRGARNV